MGTYYTTRAVLPAMIAQSGDIINISSTAGLAGNTDKNAQRIKICFSG
jgi:3-oxoacyl-[acyl-carrier protein] reductase